MKRSRIDRLFRCGTLVAAAFILFCLFPFRLPNVLADQLAPLKEMTVNLHRNFRHLKSLQRDVLTLATEAGETADAQLLYLQRIAENIDRAALICRYQWALLSIAQYIRPESLPDFATLRHSDLGDAAFETNETLKQLLVHDAYVRYELAAAPVQEAAGLIRGNIHIYERLQEMLLPLKNPSEIRKKRTAPSQ